MKWRWDQGRLDYFQFQEIKNISRALVSLEGLRLPVGNEADFLRTTLAKFTKLPFLPDRYKVWRNYKRVFGCQMLVTEIDEKLVCTELCKGLATDQIEADDYFFHIVTNFSLSSPVFEDYDSHGDRVFPLCGIVRLLISRCLAGKGERISLEEIVTLLRGNKFTGDESMNFFLALEPKKPKLKNDELRQIREMVRFASQMSFLKWDNPYLLIPV